MPTRDTTLGWRRLLAGWPWFRGPGRFPLHCYSEVLPPVWLVRRPYGAFDGTSVDDADPWGWPVTEYEEALELRLGLCRVAGELLQVMADLARGRPGEELRGLLVDNPCWPEEMVRHRGGLRHERYILLAPLALSRTPDDRVQPVWTVYGGSARGPAWAFWQGFRTGPGEEWSADHAAGFLRRLLHAAYGEKGDPAEVGFRILPIEGADAGLGWDEGPLPTWAGRYLWSPEQTLRGVKYLLTFRPFAALPETVRRAYRDGRLNLLPFPGSLAFWGPPEYRQLAKELPGATEIPLLMALTPSTGENGLRVPQAGWFAEEVPPAEAAHGPERPTVRRRHRYAREFWGGEVDVYEDKLAHVLFSTEPDDVGLYNKPQASDTQIWTADFHALLDGPAADRRELEYAAEVLRAGGRFGYRFRYPPMRVGRHSLTWHRPLVACRAGHSGRAEVFFDGPLGVVTAEGTPALELWPRLLARPALAAAVAQFRNAREGQAGQTLLNVRKLLETSDALGGAPLPRSFAERLLTLENGGTLDGWLADLPKESADRAAGAALADELRNRLAPPGLPAARSTALTFGRTARRSFEVAYWNWIARLSAGQFHNKSCGDCSRDAATQANLHHHRRDLPPLAEALRHHHERMIARAGLAGRAAVGLHSFPWRTVWPYRWLGGWVANQNGSAREQNVVVVIPGRDRSRAVLMVDHYDTAFMHDWFDEDEGGIGAHLATPGADDNCSATAALLLAAPVLLSLSRRGKLACDIWLVHITGEEFPTDGVGTRRLCQDLIQGTLDVRAAGGRRLDLSGVTVQGAYVLDMIAHRSRPGRNVFQIAPGPGRQALWLAELAHRANELWNASATAWNRRDGRHDRPRRSPDPKVVPPPARFPRMTGEVRPSYDPRSTHYNADSVTFSDVGVPAVLLMEDYDIDRRGYHDSHDTVALIDLDYGAALAAIAVEAVALAATEPPP